jgi:hypothetical protein
MVDYQEHSRPLALRDVLMLLRSRLGVMSVPDRECAYALVKYHKITVEDLLDLAVEQARRT